MRWASLGLSLNHPLPELHLDEEKVGSCGLMGEELVEQERGNGGFCGHSSTQRAAKVNEMQPVSPQAPSYASLVSLIHSSGRTEMSPAQCTATKQQALPFP